MKVKQAHKKSPLPRFIRDFFRTKKLLSRGILALVSLASLTVLFFAILGYGANLKQIGQTTYFKNMVVQMANLDFSFVKKYAKGRLEEFDDIQMDIKFKHLLRIQYLREQALKDGYISSAMKEEEFPAKMTLNGKPHNVKISLTGLVAISHLKDPIKWSFQVKVKGDDTFAGMKRFGMLRPSTRGYMTDWLGFELMKERGLMGLRVDYVNLTINGKAIGTYYLEERFDKYLVENNSLRHGIIFKLDGELAAYQESKLLEDPATRDQLLMIKRIWQEVMAGNLPPERFFDMEKMGKVFVICDLMNNKHPLALQNIRFYYNPVTGLAEPIAREWEKLERSEVADLRLFLEKPKPGTRHFKFVGDPILRIIYDNLEFKRHYVREAEIVSQTKFLDQVLQRNDEKIQSLLSKVYRTWPFYELPTHKLYENQNYMRSVLFPEEDQLAAYFGYEDHNTLQLSLHNQQYLPVEVSYVSWRDSIFFYPQALIVLDTKEKEQPQLFNFTIPKGVKWSKESLKELKVHYKIYGLESGKRTVGVSPQAVELKVVNRKDKQAPKGTYASFDFVKEDQAKHLVSIPAGKWILSKDLIIPAKKQLEIAPGAQIDLINGASIISYSPISVNGEEEMPVLIMSSDSSSRGINVIRVDQRSQLSHVVFDKIAGPEANDGLLQGAVTFFESPVNIYACTFSNGRTGKDYLHILRSDFTLDNCLFKNIAVNALSADFSTGVITNSSFVNIGQDGIVSSGSRLRIEQIFLNNIGAEALAARENSLLSIRWADIRYAETGIAAIGQSVIELTDVLLDNNDIGITTYKENTTPETAHLNAERLEIKHTATPYRIAPNASMKLNGAPLGENQNNVLDKIKNLVEFE